MIHVMLHAVNASRFVNKTKHSSGALPPAWHILHTARHSSNSATKKFQFLFIGGLLYRKGIDILVRVFLDTFTATDPVRLVMRGSYRATGSDPGVAMSTHLDSIIRQAQSDKNAAEVVMLDGDADTVSDDDMAALYAQSDCYVLPYRGEVGVNGVGDKWWWWWWC